MIANVDPSVLVAIIGAPAALIAAMGTVLLITRGGKNLPPSVIAASSTTADLPLTVAPEPLRTNGYRYVTNGELKEIIADVKLEMRASEERQNAKLELIVSLLKDK